MAHGFMLLATGVIFLSLVLTSDAAFDVTKSYRCRCVCPKGHHQTQDQAVFIEKEADPRSCKCSNVVPNATIEFCLQCKCQVESFNSVLIKFIIVLILVFFSVLLGVLIWQCLLEVYQKKRRAVALSVSARDVVRPVDRFPSRSLTPLTDDDTEESGASFSLQGGRGTPLNGDRQNTTFQRTVRRVADTVVGAQQELQRQRAYVYDRHALLS